MSLLRGDKLVRVAGALAVATVVAVGAVGCGGGDAESGDAGSVEMAEAPAAEPRVFFAAPRDQTDHATEIPLGFTFGTENYEISPVPGEAGTPRADMGHYHLGVNAECLPVGEIIPAADPWVHFGDGSDGMEMTLEGGEYRFSVQIGDDEHRTLEGLCETITVRMEDGI
ncbi:MAG TPA: DUF4399 domain-containing protein [Acidobacteria bacterium]|nr:DUF4399 domain-containing protein [Acidobacteriota bacterium]